MSKRKDPERGRIPIPIRRMGFEVMADPRTARKRSRSDKERAALDAEIAEQFEDELYLADYLEEIR